MVRRRRSGPSRADAGPGATAVGNPVPHSVLAVSIQVSPDDLADVVAELAPDAFVITVGDDGRPKIMHVLVRIEQGELVATVGRGTAANVDAGCAVTLMFAPTESGAMSLIVDGRGRVVPDTDPPEISVAATGAVWHRSPYGDQP